MRGAFFLFPSVLMVAVVMTGCSDLGNPIRPQPRSEVSATALDFGTLAVSASATRGVTVSNSGTAALTGTASVSCAGYSLLSGGGAFSIAPGGSRTVVLQFSPGSVGSFPCTLDLGPNCPQVAILGVGAIQVPGARCTVLPDSVYFGSTPVGGQGNPGSFQVFSTGTAPLLVNIVSTSDDYVVVSGGGSVEIPPGGSLNVLVEFRPQAGQRRPGVISVGPGCPDVSAGGIGTTISLQSDILPILAANCTQSCHDHRFTSYPLYGDLVYYITPFDTTNSYLYFRITYQGPNPQYGYQMPPYPAPLIPQADRDKIRDWILEGATNN